MSEYVEKMPPRILTIFQNELTDRPPSQLYLLSLAEEGGERKAVVAMANSFFIEDHKACRRQLSSDWAQSV